MAGGVPLDRQQGWKLASMSSNVSHIWTRMGPGMAACKEKVAHDVHQQGGPLISMPCTTGHAAPAATEADATDGEGADTELPSPVEIVEQRALRKAKKVALFLAYNGKGYLVRHCCCSIYGWSCSFAAGLDVRQTGWLVQTLR